MRLSASEMRRCAGLASAGFAGCSRRFGLNLFSSRAQQALSLGWGILLPSQPPLAVTI